MGLFDTIIVDPPLTCSRCGSQLEIQTKHFDPVLLTYRVGSVISGAPVLSGILPETVFCSDCHRAGREQTHEHLYRDVSEDEAPDAARAFARIFRLPDEVLDAEDPLAEILLRHKETSPELDGMF